MRTCRLYNKPVRGVPGIIGLALAYAFTRKMFAQLAQGKPMHGITLLSNHGLAQVVFAHGYWIVSGSYWGLKNPPKDMIDDAYRFLHGTHISREAVAIAMMAAYQADQRWLETHPLPAQEEMIIRPRRKQVTA